MKVSLLAVPLLVGSSVFAAVPNRITYQGRLMKSGITAAGTIRSRFASYRPPTAA